MTGHNANYVGGDIAVGGNEPGGARRTRRAAEPLGHNAFRGVPLLVGNPAGCRRARHGGLLRGAHLLRREFGIKELAEPRPCMRFRRAIQALSDCLRAEIAADTR